MIKHQMAGYGPQQAERRYAPIAGRPQAAIRRRRALPAWQQLTPAQRSGSGTVRTTLPGWPQAGYGCLPACRRNGSPGRPPAPRRVRKVVDDAIAASLRDRLAALDRALQRLDEGTYGRSILSGQAIPDERLDADPAAELTVEEARARP